MKNKNLKITVLVFGMSLLFSANSYAQSGGKEGQKTPPTFKKLIKEMDADENGKLSENEVKGPLKNDFAKIDTDEDGFITEEEFKKAPKPKRGPKN